jgi:hypothetical protein
MRTRRSIACIATAALAGSLALAVPQVAGASNCTQRRAKVTVDKTSKAIQPGGTAYFTLKVKAWTAVAAHRRSSWCKPAPTNTR